MADETNLGGRPYTGRDVQLSLRVRPSHKDMIKDVAKDRGVNLSILFEQIFDRFDLVEEILDLSEEEIAA